MSWAGAKTFNGSKGGTRMSDGSNIGTSNDKPKDISDPKLSLPYRWLEWRRQRALQDDRWLTLLPLFSLLGCVALVIYAVSQSSWAVLGYGSIVGVTSTLVGGLVGVLFGIPRSSEGSKSQQTGSDYVPNTNLEQVSDWLTKILVGVGLVQLGHAPDALERLANSMKSGFGESTSSASFGLALSLSFAIAGFIYFYLWSHIFFIKDFTKFKNANGKPAPSTGGNDRGLPPANGQGSSPITGPE
jgi:hypothetical protein